MTELEVHHLHSDFGSEVRGLDPGAPIGVDTARELRALFDERGLLLFRGATLDVWEQVALAYLLIGESTPQRDALPDRLHNPYFVSNKEPNGGAPFGRLLFHSDGMWQEQPFQLLSLYAVHVEPPVTPTCFVSTTSGWERLPPDLRMRLEHLHVEHGHDATYSRGEGDGDVLVATFDEEQSVVTPIGHRHTRTGRTMLYVSQMMTKRVVELPPEASEALLEELFTHLYAPENQLNITWEQGDLVMWDNLALQHARPNVTGEGPARTLRKVFAPLPQLSQQTQRPVQRTRAAI